MARPLRVEYAGALYHVMNRWNRRERVFRAVADYRLFLDSLAAACAACQVDVLGYCLMPNHFHLFLRTAAPNLSRFMQSLLTSFTVTMNRRQRSSGHLFQGRFKAQLVEGVGYFDVLSRYIHLNPVRGSRVGQLPVEQRLSVLHEYRWSSYRAMIGVETAPEWLRAGAVLQGFGSEPREQMKAYRLYVEEGLLKGVDDPAAAVQMRSVLGSDSFTDWVKREFLLRRRATADLREQPELRGAQTVAGPDQWLAAVAAEYGIAMHLLCSRRCRRREARDLAMYLLARHCRSGTSRSALARSMEMSLSGFVHACERVRCRLADRQHPLHPRMQAVCEQVVEGGKRA
jgi:REP element-mobilizing transposase RayT